MKRRSTRQTFDQKCRCIMHDIWFANDKNGDDGDAFARNIEKGKFRKSVIEEMRGKEMLSLRAYRLCIKCYDRYNSECSLGKEMSTVKIRKREAHEETIKENKGARIEKSITDLIELLENCDHDDIINPTTNTLWEKLMFLLGEKLCRENIYKNGLGKCKDTKFLTDLDISKFIKEGNSLLVMFIFGFSGIDLNQESNEVKYALAQTLELCYYLRNLHLVLPYSFLANLVQSCISGSKSVAVVNGKTSPGEIIPHSKTGFL